LTICPQRAHCRAAHSDGEHLGRPRRRARRGQRWGPRSGSGHAGADLDRHDLRPKRRRPQLVSGRCRSRPRHRRPQIGVSRATLKGRRSRRSTLGQETTHRGGGDHGPQQGEQGPDRRRGWRKRDENRGQDLRRTFTRANTVLGVYGFRRTSTARAQRQVRDVGEGGDGPGRDGRDRRQAGREIASGKSGRASSARRS